MTPSNRRRFLGSCTALGASATAAPWLAQLAALGAGSAATPARAGGASGYKALVCLFFYGGNDAFNTVLPTDAPSWAAYLAARDQDDSSIALLPPGTPPAHGADVNKRLGGVLPIQPLHAQGRTFALHPALDTLPDLFAQKRLAIVPNVGPLVQPTSKADYLAGSVPLPPKLFSHNDQQSVWQSMGAEGTRTGWGGGLVDRVMKGNVNPIFTSISMNGSAVWLAGKRARPYQLGLDGPIHIGSDDGTLFSSIQVQQTLETLMRTPRSSRVVEVEHAQVVDRSMAAYAVLAPAFPPANQAPWGSAHVAPGKVDPLLMYRAPSTGERLPNPIAQQLQAVARMIATHAALGTGRQVFFVGVDGFDTHDDQNDRHADVMAQLAQALSYWDTVTQGMGVDEQVTTFTASDFGRAFPSNGSGSDHGWGAHHFVLGGAVRGGDLHGAFPAYGLSDDQGGYSSDDQVDDGALLPIASVDQYAATLGAWFGVPPDELTSVLPNLANFPPAQRDLGFMKG
ncbi:MAG TPA: DUF1501 domain-containing protein [Burkholderiaceae bacterium]|nr:DUF1501 domain-containing protein [Burkholderiaceae bacterium]